MTEGRLSGLKVLVVEDDVLIGFDLEASLIEAGAIVLGPAGDLRGAFALLGANTPDVAVLDINLERETALPIADALDDVGTPFFFLTGHDRSVLPPRHRGRLVMTKPFGRPALINAVAVLLMPHEDSLDGAA